LHNFVFELKLSVEQGISCYSGNSFFKSDDYFLKGINGDDKISERGNHDTVETKGIHAGVCVKTLPQVYDPKARPWINIENATTEELIGQVAQCPSGALSIEKNDDTKKLTG
jgi:uncharacterized Fe-S cluster protein YjdI